MHVLTLILWLLCGGQIFALNLSEESARELFQQFKNKYHKNYNGYDNEKRFEIFKTNLKRAEEFQQSEQGTAQYGVTRFSDLTAEEFRSQFANAKVDPNWRPDSVAVVSSNRKIPKKVNWLKRGAVTPVEDQGHCASCWAFSVAGNIEGQWYLKKGVLIPLSKQQLLDCDKRDHGCDGGYPPRCYDEVKRMGGLASSEDYPYKAASQTCQLNQTLGFAAFVNASMGIPENEEIQKKWLAENGPMSALINSEPLQFYQSGILFPAFCPVSGIDHAVLTIGYGQQKGYDYWLVKNSWGKNWGEEGYFRIYRGRGVCGINSMCTTAVIY